MAPQHAAHGMPQAKHEIGGDGVVTDGASDAVGAEVASAHGWEVSLLAG